MTDTDCTTNRGIYEVLFKFYGQSRLPTWQLLCQPIVKQTSQVLGWYEHDLVLSFQQINDLVEGFSFYQRRKKTGRPAFLEKDVMKCFLLKQFLQTTYRRLSQLLVFLKDYFHLSCVPDATTLSLKNRSRRWSHLWRRFMRYCLRKLPHQRVMVCTDATGFSGRKISWRETPYPFRCRQDWVKLHAMVEAHSLLIVEYQMTDGDVHESQVFPSLLEGLDECVDAVVGLADGGYSSNHCLLSSWRHGVLPVHGVRKDAVVTSEAVTPFQELSWFKECDAEVYAAVYGLRNQVESVFHSMQSCFGYRLKSRSKRGRINEVACKINAHNIRMISRSSYGEK